MSEVVLDWGVKASFRGYVAAAGGAITVVPPAIAGDDIARFPMAISEPGDVRFRGAIRFTAHHGLLDVTIADPWIEASENGSNLTAAGTSGRRIAIATLGPPEAIVGGTRRSAALTRAGCSLLGDFYRVGTALDDLLIRSPRVNDGMVMPG